MVLHDQLRVRVGPTLMWNDITCSPAAYLHGRVGQEVGGLGIEGLAELHHVQTQRAQRLTDCRSRLRGARRHSQPHLTME